MNERKVNRWHVFDYDRREIALTAFLAAGVAVASILALTF